MNLWSVKQAIFGIIVLLSMQAGAGHTETVTLNALDGTVSLSGELIEFTGTTYVLGTPVGEMIVEASQVECIGAGCPNLVAESTGFTLSGAITMGEDLMPALIEAFALERGRELEAGTTAEGEKTYTVLEPDGTVYAVITVRSSDSVNAFADLIEGSADIGMSSRRINKAEVAAFDLGGKGKMRSAGQERVVAMDGVVVAVHAGNPVQVLDMAQIAGVFDGSITNWQQLGGADAPITVYRQAETSGAAAILAAQAEGLVFSEAATVLASERAVSEAVMADENGIGLTSFARLQGAQAVALRSPCGAVFAPENYALKTEEYPLSRRLYFYTTRANLPDVANEFLAFVASPRAQDIIDNAGFVGQNPGVATLASQGRRMAQGIVAASGRTELLQLQDITSIVLDAKRLSFTLRFDEDGALDSRALQDIERLAAMIRNREFLSRQILLFGFSDNTKSSGIQLNATQGRAQDVRDALVRATGRAKLGNVRISPIGYGSLFPLACNETSAGRARNNRVEIWIK
jgi:phosphate transport system substrate-binding protein